MAAKIYYDNDASPEALQGQRIAVLGYGSQGRAHALNLRDSGYEVVVGLRKDSPSWTAAEADGFPVASINEAVADADVVAVLLPDQHQAKVYAESIEPNLRPGATLMFAHGFSIHFGQVRPPSENDVVMIAPKAPGPLVRRTFEDNKGTPALIAVHQDATGRATERALAYGRALGCTRAGVIETTFAEETETDLFGEQAVLCGGTSRLIQAGFETLVEAGYQPEIAYFECLHEMKLIVDLIYEGGLSWMRYSVSDTAEWGDYTSGARVIDDRTRETMRRILDEIQDGSFAKRWIAEADGGFPEFLAKRREARSSQLEEVGRQLRTMMPWLRSEEKVPPS
jgi:ketol-acid reductoisomerase